MSVNNNQKSFKGLKKMSINSVKKMMNLGITNLLKVSIPKVLDYILNDRWNSEIDSGLNDCLIYTKTITDEWSLKDNREVCNENTPSNIKINYYFTLDYYLNGKDTTPGVDWRFTDDSVRLNVYTDEDNISSKKDDDYRKNYKLIYSRKIIENINDEDKWIDNNEETINYIIKEATKLILKF